jgi:S-formylglutathione hydrolase FrmB
MLVRVSSHAVETLSVASGALRRTLPCTLLLPRGRAPEAVLYLLHGGYSHRTEWTERVDLAAMVSPWPLAVALPEGESSLWIHGHDGRDFERYTAFDVPEAVEAKLGIAPGRERRTVAGLSMGGLGALHLGLTHPERYAAVASISGAFGMTWWNIGRFEGSPFLPALGPLGSGTRARVDPWRTLERALARVGPGGLPALWLATGTEDDPEVTEAHRALHASLDAAGVGHAYAERPGGHDWEFWRRETPALLAFIAQECGLAPRSR